MLSSTLIKSDVLVNLSVIIPQFGQSELTVACVSSLVKYHPRIEVIIVDDGSPVVDVLNLQRQGFPQISIMRCSKNQGVTAAWNLGASVAQGDHLIFLNNDTYIKGPWCDRLLAPLVSRSDPQMVGVEFRREKFLPAALKGDKDCQQLLAGWCFAVSRELFEQIGRFDERLRMYFSDTDFQLRVVHEFGSQALHAVPDLPVTHAQHQTTRCLSSRKRQWRHDQAVFAAKWDVIHNHKRILNALGE